MMPEMRHHILSLSIQSHQVNLSETCQFKMENASYESNVYFIFEHLIKWYLILTLTFIETGYFASGNQV